MFKVGDIVISNEDRGGSLTKGQLYEVKKVWSRYTDNFIQVVTNRGELLDFFSWRFEKIDDSSRSDESSQRAQMKIIPHAIKMPRRKHV